MSFHDDIDSVYNSNTSRYFKEVINSFYNENYRSAVVMLYSVVICDLLYKIIDLRDIYGDTTASDILQKVENTRNNAEQLSAWENKLIEEISSRTSLLDNDVYTNLKHLRNHRNFSAHPAINNEYELFVPNRETVASHIRNMLDGVLKKPPIFAKKITQMLSEDLKQKREIYSTNGTEFHNYLYNRYFRHMSDSMICAVFKDLWKFVYILDNEDTNACKKINHWTMMYMLSSYGSLLTSATQKHSESYQISVMENTGNLAALCTMYTPFYSVLPSETRQALVAKAKGSKNIRLISIFLSANTCTHIENIINEIRAEPQEWQLNLPRSHARRIREWLIDEGRLDIYIELIITLLESCKSYNKADGYFDCLVKTSLADFTFEEIKRLLNAICDNGILSQRTRAYEDNNEIVSFVIHKFGHDSIDFSVYPSFMYNNLIIENTDSSLDDNVTVLTSEDSDELPL